MKKTTSLTVLTSLIAVLLLVSGCAQMSKGYVMNKNVKRVGMVVGIKPDKIEEYKRLHADGNAGVRDLLNKYHMHNFSIFLTEIGGKWYEFGYYEYAGDDFDADMAELAKEPRNIEWLQICDPMQIPLEGETSWREMERVYFNP
ncbi:MAG: L-rhamnose mutarotase [Phycisphaerales bacterium]|nr:MAG: L-rhamnose mutarotase [Phycisphaerales bacterium]